jgi:chromosome segregation ATPase
VRAAEEERRALDTALAAEVLGGKHAREALVAERSEKRAATEQIAALRARLEDAGAAAALQATREAEARREARGWLGALQKEKARLQQEKAAVQQEKEAGVAALASCRAELEVQRQANAEVRSRFGAAQVREAALLARCSAGEEREQAVGQARAALQKELASAAEAATEAVERARSAAATEAQQRARVEEEAGLLRNRTAQLESELVAAAAQAEALQAECDRLHVSVAEAEDGQRCAREDAAAAQAQAREMEEIAEYVHAITTAPFSAATVPPDHSNAHTTSPTGWLRTPPSPYAPPHPHTRARARHHTHPRARSRSSVCAKVNSSSSSR